MSIPLQISDELPVQPEVSRIREEPRFMDALDLVALPSAIPVARMFISNTLRHWHALFIQEHMEAVAVALVTLSVEATSLAEGTNWTDITKLNPITLRMLGYQRHIIFEVTDAHDEALQLPQDHYVDESAGLGLVDALASRWGSFVQPQGRVIWAELSVYARTEAGLPKRDRRPSPWPRGSTLQPARTEEPTLLRQVVDGLRNL